MRFRILVALTATMMLVLAACNDATDESATTSTEGTEATETTGTTTEDVEEPEVTETTSTTEPEGAEDEASEIYTMLELWERDPDEQGRHENLREISAVDAVPMAIEVDDTVQIALIYPSFDVSEGWARGAIAFDIRLSEFGLDYEITEFGSEIDDHATQASHIATVLAGDFDYVLLGPTELDVQRSGIRDLIDDPDTEVMIWNYNTPIREWDELGQPLSYVTDGDHAEGGLLLCEWVLEETGGEGEFATMRFTPGFLDDQRVGTFVDCATAGGMELAYDHFADGTRELAFEGTNAAVAAYPDLAHIHASNTATALGTIAALEEQGLEDDIIVNGWGGGEDELASLLEGGLQVTPMRMQDDWGVYPAEIIKMHLEGRNDEIPLAAAAEMVLVDYRTSEDEINELRDYAFRYSGELDR